MTKILSGYIQAEETDEDTNEKEYVMRWGK